MCQKFGVILLFSTNGHQRLFEYAFDCSPSPRIVGRRRLWATPQISETQRGDKELWAPKLRSARAQAFVDVKASWDLDGC